MIRKVKCKKYGTEYKLLEQQDGHAAHAYVTAACFDGEEAIVTARVRSLTDNTADYVWTDLNTGEERVLFQDGRWPLFTVLNGKLYHFKGSKVLVTDIASGQTKTIWEGSREINCIPAVTQDGHYLTLSWYQEDQSTTAALLDTRTGVCEELFRKSFPWPYQQISHCMVNPVNPRYYFFCHEGDCCYIMNRLWMLDRETKEMENFFHQRLDGERGNGEPCGHEMWAFDGRGMYFIKYISTTILPGGVWYIDLATRETTCVASGHPYWHVGVSPDGRHLAADTQVYGADYSDVIWIDSRDKRECPLVRIRINGVHPCHPHPVFSPKGQKVCFTCLNEEGRLAVGIVDAAEQGLIR